MQTEVIVRNDRALREFDEVRPMGYDEAVRRAMARLATDDVETSDTATASRPSPERVFDVICALGGDDGARQATRSGSCAVSSTGLSAAWACVAADVTRESCAPVIPSTSGGSRSSNLRTCFGESRDEAARQGLAAVRGAARRRRCTGRTNCAVRAAGIFGQLYWYSVRPFHRFAFPGLISAIGERAETA